MSVETTVQTPQDLLIRLGEKFETLLRAEEALAERRMEIAQILAEVQEVSVYGSAPVSADAEALKREVEELRRQLAERDRQIASGSGTADPERAKKLISLEAENAVLLRQLVEKNREIGSLRTEMERFLEASPEAREAVDYEAELNEFRRELEKDRQTLNEEIDQLRARNAELNDTARQAELDLSRERAQLARERAQLDRIRDEIRQEVERAQREAGVREHLAPVQRLKEEISDRKQDAKPASPVQRPSGSRWGNLLKRVSDLSKQ